eukprot:TRINITY_DN19322_c0_g2_i1.p1 TRINITY_DN19322_c0_g2~~TRINITY_DN19322_c0_g2_i1.p1  ORF type:complete len:839 (-),score=129.95 TRINITY_DN19322_c0_g2_i1:175-2556(-)
MPTTPVTRSPARTLSPPITPATISPTCRSFATSQPAPWVAAALSGGPAYSAQAVALPFAVTQLASSQRTVNSPVSLVQTHPVDYGVVRAASTIFGFEGSLSGSTPRREVATSPKARDSPSSSVAMTTSTPATTTATTGVYEEFHLVGQQAFESDWCGVGKVCEIANLHFRCSEILGRGSYSVVWRAEQVDVRGFSVRDHEPGSAALSEAVALKEVHCGTQTSLLQAVFEVQVLLALERAAPQNQKVPLCVPRCIAYRVDPHQNEGWTVRTAMTVVPGESLDVFFRRPPPVDCDGRCGGLLTAVKRGCALARKLLQDLGPVLQLLEPIAWHRDVNSHNILVDVPPAKSCGHTSPEADDGEAEAGRASFWLIDFGLAVDSQSWTAAKWRTEHIGGDSRYWPPSSWIMHLLGPEGFEDGREHHGEQYRRRLDVHGLGITALELLCSVALVAESVNDEANTGVHPRQAAAARGLDACWTRLLDAWEKYWDNVWRWWSMVYTIFSNGGNIAPVQAALMQEGMIERLGELLEELREMLRQCAFNSQENGDMSTARLLRVIADMIDENCEFRLDGLEVALAGPKQTVSLAAKEGESGDGHHAVAMNRSRVRGNSQQTTTKVSVLKTGPCVSSEKVMAQPPMRSPRGAASSPRTSEPLPLKQATATAGGSRPVAANGEKRSGRSSVAGFVTASTDGGATTRSVRRPSPGPNEARRATSGGKRGSSPSKVARFDIGLESLTVRTQTLQGSCGAQRVREQLRSLEASLERLEERRLSQAKLSMDKVAQCYLPKLFSVTCGVHA